MNGRGLDVRSRLASGFERLEIAVRKAVGDRFQRGNIAVNLQTGRVAGDMPVRINWSILEQIRDAVPRLEQEFGAAPPSVDGLLAIRGVIEAVEDELDEAKRQARDAAVLAGLDEALAGLDATRRAEGGQLAALVVDQVARIEQLVGDAETVAAGQPELLRDRLRQQLQALLADTAGLSEDRLAQEVAVLATKADVREELDRLRAHVAAVRELLGDGGVIGRRLDFMAQEFNREANTLCSKSQDPALTRVGLELKTVIDQLREQAQNIE